VLTSSDDVLPVRSASWLRGNDIQYDKVKLDFTGELAANESAL
jgi:hypothetical protein